MSIVRSFKATDLFKFNHMCAGLFDSPLWAYIDGHLALHSNLDLWTETYAINFYLGYFCRWPDMCAVQETPQGRIMGYVIGKAEGRGPELHGHVTALTVAPEYRRLGLSRKFMAWLERVSDENYHGCFVDLYVRCVNFAAIGMYEGLGYSVYRRVREYYSNLGLGFGVRDEEDGFDMRKPLPRDPMRRSVRANGRDIAVSASEVS
uniref:Palmitoyltransferase PFA3 ) n=1 Tax=Ganoderma boninense TaxID=34458 RepID=A0A5K1JZ80_9APHY|nr:Palmitoyltransferase PFA3 (EC (Protein fatty acyltransferase 3) [Ganoderma boninense]